jgi:hypothetical protein
MTEKTAVRIVAERPAGRSEWERHCGACEYATFFHTPLWADAVCRQKGGRRTVAPLHVAFSDGTAAVVPLVQTRLLGGALHCTWSMPAFTFGGWVSADPLTIAHARLLAARLCSIRDLVWRENPYDPVLTHCTIDGADDDFTQAIDLREGFAAASKRFDHAHRKAVRKARAAGVTVVEASDHDAWKRYFSLYQASRGRWRRRGLQCNRGYGPALFDVLREIPSAHRKLWLAMVGDEMAAGILCFYWNGHAVAWHGAGAERHFRHRPNNLLYEHAIRHAADAGCRWFDCNPSGGLAGVVEFKQHLGARRLRSRIVNKRSLVRTLVEWMRRIMR